MRFLDDGPDIPGDLLYARDAGEVIFFCGAGVSRAKAGGPSFRELAERVVARLGSAQTSPARQLLELSEGIVPPPGVGGMPPADRIFALLEQEFTVEDVRSAVALAVKPKDDPGLGPHRSLIDLSTIADGTTRLVTTNFDRVFQLAAPHLNEILPPNLLDPRRPEPWRGIVHLHGMVTPDYAGAALGEFVLSSADFGRAYLADGWATAFMRALMERYRIVFVGYSADDPPIQYLLEALSPTGRPGSLYAFHSGAAEEAAALWRHKGVTAIPFSGFDALWNSLDVWATRARDPDAWRASVISKAGEGPRSLSPVERGMVAHIVSSKAGARAFARADPVPPAEWLCVFDPAVRYDRERRSAPLGEESDRFTAFEAFGLDADLPPLPTTSPSQSTIPAGAWSALDALDDDTGTDPSRPNSSLRGMLATQPAYLPPRLEALSDWIGRVSKNPVAAWWAAGQGGLHPSLANSVERNVDQHMDPVMRRAWRLILSAPAHSPRFEMNEYSLLNAVNAEGWSLWAIRQLDAYERPWIKVSRAYTSPPLGGAAELRRLVHADVEYPNHLADLVIPDEHLARYVRTVRGFLEMAAPLELEAGDYFFAMLQPIVPFDDPGSDFVDRQDGLAALVINMARHMKRLAKFDSDAARREMLSWPRAEDKVFGMLHVWATGLSELMSAEEAGNALGALPQEIFWEREVQRDLLVALAARWHDLGDVHRKTIEARILAGPDPWESAETEEFARYRTHRILSRLLWLEREHLKVGFDIEEVRRSLLATLPGWTEADGQDEIYRSTSRGGWVATVTDPGPLLEASLDTILEASDAASGRGRDFLVENRPFRGLAEQRPVRALAALVRAAQKGDIRKQEWSDFLWHEERAKDPPRLKRLIAERLCGIPSEVFLRNLQAVAEWVSKAGKDVHGITRSTYLKIWGRAASAVVASPNDAASGIVSDSRKDWHMAAINSPGGRIASVLCDEFGWEGPNKEKMTDEWRVRAELLLAAEGAPRCHVSSIFGQRLNWLYHADPLWAEEHLISDIESEPRSDTSQAALTSLLSFGGQWSRALFQRLKQTLVVLAGEVNGEDRHERNIPTSLLAGWNSRDEEGKRLVSDQEMREILLSLDNEARVAVVRRLGHWAERSGDWQGVIAFVERVWPRQLVARTPAAASALAGLAMAAGDAMPEVAQAVIPLLSPADDSWSDQLHLRTAKNDLVDRFPEEHLAVLYAVLGEDPRWWPYGAAALIEKLGGIETTRNDPRLGELRRRIARR